MMGTGTFVQARSGHAVLTRCILGAAVFPHHNHYSLIANH
jgi:hypothetical protein